MDARIRKMMRGDLDDGSEIRHRLSVVWFVIIGTYQQFLLCAQRSRSEQSAKKTGEEQEQFHK